MIYGISHYRIGRFGLPYSLSIINIYDLVTSHHSFFNWTHADLLLHFKFLPLTYKSNRESRDQLTAALPVCFRGECATLVCYCSFYLLNPALSFFTQRTWSIFCVFCCCCAALLRERRHRLEAATCRAQVSGNSGQTLVRWSSSLFLSASCRHQQNHTG